jgi:hypothetical protein
MGATKNPNMYHIVPAAQLSRRNTVVSTRATKCEITCKTTGSQHTRAQTEAVDGLIDLERVHGVHFQRHAAEETTKI